MRDLDNSKIVVDDEQNKGKSAAEIDEERENTSAYEYLCRLEEAKKWIEACLKEQLPPTTDLEENLRNGVYLAKLGHFMEPSFLPLNKIYDIEQKRFLVAGLQFRHTDNINHFLQCLQKLKLPVTFRPETTDVYDKKNMPRLIYCIHALSRHLFKQGKAPQIQDLYGRIQFTNEEIDAVTKELKKLGIQMPSFQKIGGLLTNSVAGDTAALHAAVIAINQSLLEKDKISILFKMQNSAAELKNVDPSNLNLYYETLLQAKEAKVETAMNRSLNETYIPDAYDENLTQAEIQGHINDVNAKCAVERIKLFIKLNDAKFMDALQSQDLQLKNIRKENVELYTNQVTALFNAKEWKSYSSEHFKDLQAKLQNAIDTANDIASGSYERDMAVDLLNAALENESRYDFSNALKHPKLALQNMVDDYAMPLYYEEIKIDREDNQANLSYEDIRDSVRVLTSIAEVSKNFDCNDVDTFYEKLSNPHIPITVLYSDLKDNYYHVIKSALQKRKTYNPGRPMLSYQEIQACVDQVNEHFGSNDDATRIFKQLFDAVKYNDRQSVITALKDPHLWKDHSHLLDSMRPISIADAPLYIKSLERLFEANHHESVTINDIVYVLQIVFDEAERAETMCSILSHLNKAIVENDRKNILRYIRHFNPTMITLTEEEEEKCIKDLRNMKKTKERYKCPWVNTTTHGGNSCFLNIKACTYSWDCPENFESSCYINLSDIQGIINQVVVEGNIKTTENLVEDLCTKLQARARGYLLRQKLNDKYGANAGNDIEKKSSVLDYYQKHEDKIIKIQALWRGYVVRRDYYLVLRLDKPPYSVVRHFSTILHIDADDYDKDLELQLLKNEVVQAIKHNRNLSEQLDSMDLKIGLLIQNRVSLKDVVAHGKSLEHLVKNKSLKGPKNALLESAGYKGLKSFTKEGRKRLEGYQRLFYTLQINPLYLSKLIFLLPESKTSKFLQNAILTVFNFGSNTREEHLLLKLLGTALREEIKCKFSKPSEIVTGNPLVLKMALNYSKQVNGKRALRQILGPVIEKILDDKNITIETNPVDIYKCWRNQLEMETGEVSNLPYSVSQEKALQYEQVQSRLNNGIRLLQSTVQDLLSRITASRDSIPYGLLYMSKILNETLSAKFPNAPEKEILKVIGNLIYYHFINAAIVNPDAYDIITLQYNRCLSNDQRRNLASIAKILQFAASKKGFGEEARHLICLNPFIIECHEKFKTFFRQCCQIEDLDSYFCYHEYTEATLIQRPQISISLQEICDTHHLIVEYQNEIAPDPMDPLHELLEDLGPPPTVATLLGIDDKNMPESNIAAFGKTEVCLVLRNKYEVPENDLNLNKLFIKTKELLLSALKNLPGDSLVEALETGFSPVEDRIYDSRISNTTTTSISLKDSSLHSCKLQLRNYLNKLELGGWVSRKDGYQSIVTAVAKDLCNKGKYRAMRRKELQTLQLTKKLLEEKRDYYNEQVTYYTKYIEMCLVNLQTGKSACYYALKKADKPERKLKSKKALKYTALKLQEKGVLLEIDNLPQHQFKNVIFEISPADNIGIFTVRGKFMGVEMEKVEIDIQHLLELQYEGDPIMNIFGKAKINVNLLLYLLNRKYYGSKL